MRSQAWIPLAATVIALEFTMALWRRWRQSRRSYLRSWLVSFVFFTAGSASLWYGAAFGWSSLSFRSFYLCGAFLAAPWLAQGELELLAPPKLARISGVFLLLITINMVFVIGYQPFVDGTSVAGFGTPHGKDLFPIYVRVAVVVSNVIGTIVVVGGTVWSGLRSRGRGPAAASRFRGTMLITLGVLVSAAGGGLTYLGEENGLALSLVTGVALMYYGFVVASRRPAAHRAARHRRRDRSNDDTVEPGHLLDRDIEPGPELVSAG
ncbi:MAG: hypothetical protein ABIM89_17875 [Mycobacteriales bacterium]